MTVPSSHSVSRPSLPPEGRGEFVALTERLAEEMARRWRAGEQPLACQHLEDDRPERPNVRALVRRLSLRLFRRHVRCRAENHANTRHLRGAGDRR